MRHISKGINESSCRKALLNARNAFDLDMNFPNNVFTQHWDHYLFFPSDRMFGKTLVKALPVFIRLEQANTVCLLNITQSSSLEFEGCAALFLNTEITAKEYDYLISNDGAEVGWFYLMEDYICTSDVGSWCMYCEMTSDIAVLAISRAGLEQLRPALDILQPYTLEEACRPGQEGWQAKPDGVVLPFALMCREGQATTPALRATPPQRGIYSKVTNSRLLKNGCCKKRVLLTMFTASLQ
ncbi:MAG: hypothetical protein RBR37_13350 [Advenella sp.]|nr:hypothetical protein [Advenella sp.]